MINSGLTEAVLAEFWDIGHKVFRSTPESFPVKFIPGDVFDPSFLASGSIVESSLNEGWLDVSTLTSLNPLRGNLTGIHASSFFHLFDQDSQIELAHKLGSLLSPEPGSVIFGAHSGVLDGELPCEQIWLNAKFLMYCQSPESWTRMWEKVFVGRKIEVKAVLKEMIRADTQYITDSGYRLYTMYWSVKRR